MLSTTLWIRIIWENIHCQSTYKVLSTLLWVTSHSRLIFFMNVSVFFSIVFNEDILATSGSTVNWSAYDIDSSCQLTLISTFLGGFVLQQLHLHLLTLCSVLWCFTIVLHLLYMKINVHLEEFIRPEAGKWKSGWLTVLWEMLVHKL